MKRNIFVIAVAALTLCFASCQKEETINNLNPKVKVTSDLIGTNWTANLALEELVNAMTGEDIAGCEFPEGFESAMVFHLNFDDQYAHITFSDNLSVINVVESEGGYSMEEIEKMDFAYVYDGETHTGTLTAVGTDENGEAINYQIAFTYSDEADTISINLMFANAEDEDNTITFPLVFRRNA